MGRLGPALDNCQSAYRIFQNQSSSQQRHNQAVAAYALGLVYQLLGSDMHALKWYQEADDLFEKVKGNWIAVKALDRIKACNHVRGWMETLGQYLTSERARADDNLGNRIWAPIILADGEKPKFAIVELGIDKHVISRQLAVNGNSFRVQSLKGRRVSISPDDECYAVRIPQGAFSSLGATEGDYALIVRGEVPDESKGLVVLETDGGPEFGEFRRDEAGQINFKRIDATVIGGDNIDKDWQIGHIAALLKPEQD
jgi:hypothetical protein